MKISIIVQARMGSKRLPGKVLKEVLGRPLLGYLIDRLRQVKLVDRLIIATTQEASDDVIEAYANEQGVSCFRGATEDVLSRYLGAAQRYDVDVIIRITGDCPLIDPLLVEDVIKAFLNASVRPDYVSNCTISRTFPRGMDVELVTTNALRRAYKQIDLPVDYEHVTNFINRCPQLFNRLEVSQLLDQSIYRLTVDTQEDFLLIKEIIERLYPKKGILFSLKEVIDLLISEPQLVFINKNAQQKQDHL